MKKINDSTSASSDVRASSLSENLANSDVSIDINTSTAIGDSKQAGRTTTETVKPRINRKNKSKPKMGTPVLDGKSKPSDSSKVSESMPADSIEAADYSFIDGSPRQAVFSASSYRSVNESSDRIAIFIDGSNLFYAASHLNIEVDYRRLLTTLVGDRRLLRAYFYTGVDPQNEKQRGFLLWLNRHGHRVISKELTNMPDGSRKANMHVEMAVDMLRIAEHCPTITLLGGDGNLAYALETLSRRGVAVEVVSLQSMTSDSLIDIADLYVDLADLRDEIKR